MNFLNILNHTRDAAFNIPLSVHMCMCVHFVKTQFHTVTLQQTSILGTVNHIVLIKKVDSVFASV
jgi:hypothetical protein